MNVMLRAKQAYSPSAPTIRTPRSVEQQLFGQITARLQNLSETSDYTARVQALHDNRKLWSTIAIDVADPANTLPQQLRAQIFYLAEFTSEHTRKVLKKEADVDALIDINRSIMAGLQQGAA